MIHLLSESTSPLLIDLQRRLDRLRLLSDPAIEPLIDECHGAIDEIRQHILELTRN